MREPEDRWDDVLRALVEDGYLTGEEISERVADEMIEREWLFQIDDRYYLDESVARMHSLDEYE